MTAKEYYEAHETVATCSCLNGLAIKGIEFGIDDYVYCESGLLSGRKKYHRLKVLYTPDDMAYIRLWGRRVYMADCLKN